MKNLHYTFLFFVVFMSCQANNLITPSINQKEFRNENYIWWINDKNIGEWIEKDEEGEWEPKTGSISSFYDTGKIKSIKTYVNSKATGLYKVWNKKGNILMSGKLLNNRPDSLFRLFYPNGQTRVKLFFKGCVIQNAHVFNRNGIKCAKFSFKKNDEGLYPSGNQIIYYPNGQIKMKIVKGIRTHFDKKDNIIY